MAAPLPPRPLPQRASLTHLRLQAKDRLRDLRADDPGARLFQAQLDVARQHGFTSWRALVAGLPKATGRTPPAAKELMAAVVAGDAVAIERLLRTDPGLARMTMPHPFWGGRPLALHVAVERNQPACVAAMLAHGADPNGDNDAYDGWGPLLLAIHWRHAAIVATLIAAGARIGLAEALLSGDDATLNRLLADDPDALDEAVPNQATPLHFVTTVHAAEVLLGRGGNPFATDKYGKTAIDAAAGRKPPASEVLAVLRASTGATADAGQLAAEGDLNGLQQCLAADPAQRDRRFTVHWSGQPLLHIAAEYGQVEVLRWLIATGFDLVSRGIDGQTALHTACWSGQVESVRCLVEAGADVAARDEVHGNTPLGWARTNRDTLGRPGCAEIVDWLEARGAP